MNNPYGSPPYYRNTRSGRVEPLPFRITMPDGMTRTDPAEWWLDAEAREASGFVETELTADDLEWANQPEPVPESVSARQIRLWLVSHGVALAAIEHAIDSIPDAAQRDATRVEWEYAPYVERTHPMLVPLAAALGLDEAAVDTAFREAVLL
jgi:hypothetical protein